MHASFLKRLVAGRAGGAFGKSVAVLVGGTALSQLLVLLTLPILTRLYTPEEFSTLAVFIAIFSIASSISCMRYEISIPIVRSEAEAANLVALGIVISIALCVLSVLLPFFLFLVGVDALIPEYYWLFPIGFLLSGLGTSLQYWLSRQKEFSIISKNRIERALWGIGIQLIGGVLDSLFLLLLGQVIVFTGIGLSLVRNFWRTFSVWRPEVRIAGIVTALKRQRRFALYSVPEVLLNNGATHFPIVIMAYFLGGPELGYLLLATKILGGPVTLVGGAMSQVYLSYAGNQDKSRLTELTLRSLRSLLIFLCPALIVFSFVAPKVFFLVFGENWGRAGEIVLWMLPWFIFKALSSPISMSLHITGNQKAAFLLQLFGFVSRSSVTIFVAMLAPAWLIIGYALSGALFYFSYCFVVFYVASLNSKKIFVEVARAAPLNVFALIIGISINAWF